MRRHKLVALLAVAISLSATVGASSILTKLQTTEANGFDLTEPLTANSSGTSVKTFSKTDEPVAVNEARSFSELNEPMLIKLTGNDLWREFKLHEIQVESLLQNPKLGFLMEEMEKITKENSAEENLISRLINHYGNLSLAKVIESAILDPPAAIDPKLSKAITSGKQQAAAVAEDFKLTTPIEANKMAQDASTLATKLQEEQVQHWIRTKKTPDDVSELLKLDMAADNSLKA